MKLKLDENLGASIVAIFRGEGHDTLTVADEGLRSAPDRRVIGVCREEGRALVTLDLDFGNPLLFKPSEYQGIAVLRVAGRASLDHLSTLVRTLIHGLAQREIRGKLWIIEMGRIREYEEGS